MTMADAVPPVAIAAAREAVKVYLRLGNDGEDALLDRLAASAIGVAEAFLGQATVARSFTSAIPADGRWRVLPVAPVLAITGVSDGGGHALPVGGYAVDIDADARGWARVAGAGRAVSVSYRAGLAEGWDQLPAPVAQGVVMLAAHLFDQRDGDSAPLAAVAALWRPFRRVTLGAVRERCA